MTIAMSRNYDEALFASNLKEIKERKIIIKVNMVSTYTYLSMTTKESLAHLIRFLRDDLSHSGRIIIAEGPAIGIAIEGFRKLGLQELSKEYDLELFDIHEDAEVEIPIFNSRFDEFMIPVSKTILEAPFVISVCRAKTHDTVIVTLSLKNIAVGGIVGRNNRSKIHRGYKAINANIAILGGILYPDFSLIDGTIAMEGNGPVSGEPKKWGYVFAGKNSLETDSLVSYLMGFNPNTIGYLYYLGKLGFSNINIYNEISIDLSQAKTKFKPHSTYMKQLEWKLSTEEEKDLLKRMKSIISKYSRVRNKFDMIEKK